MLIIGEKIEIDIFLKKMKEERKEGGKLSKSLACKIFKDLHL